VFSHLRCGDPSPFLPFSFPFPIFPPSSGGGGREGERGNQATAIIRDRHGGPINAARNVGHRAASSMESESVAVQQIRRFIRHNRAGRTDSPSCGLSRCIAALNAVLKTVRASGPGTRMRPRSRRTSGSRAGIVATRCDGTLRARLHRLSTGVSIIPRRYEPPIPRRVSFPSPPPPSTLPQGRSRGEANGRAPRNGRATTVADLEALGNRLDARTLDGRVSFFERRKGREDSDPVDLSNPARFARKCESTPTSGSDQSARQVARGRSRSH